MTNNNNKMTCSNWRLQRHVFSSKFKQSRWVNFGIKASISGFKKGERYRAEELTTKSQWISWRDRKKTNAIVSRYSQHEEKTPRLGRKAKTKRKNQHKFYSCFRQLKSNEPLLRWKWPKNWLPYKFELRRWGGPSGRLVHVSRTCTVRCLPYMVGNVFRWIGKMQKQGYH